MVIVPFMYGCTGTMKWIITGARLAVFICADFPGSMRLVSNNLAVCGSSGVAPFVAVCGAVSVFVTVITSPFLAVSVAGV